MGKSRQAELIEKMTDREITFHLMLTQIIIFITAVIGSWWLFDSFWEGWLQQFDLNGKELLVYGVFPGLIVVAADLLLMTLLPEKHYDDGGINSKVFKTRSIPSIIGLVLVVAVSEELLFRGVIHSEFGYAAASILFAVMHIRYLKKIVLLISVLFVSFFIGYMYELTGNLTATILAHFVIDFLLALLIRFKK
ncbi:CPBP family intramembrane glutamic endopeptidase [Thalassobacillus pellis]|uniref:CPBP family intramembrane glutamic endopeptidase n=1 Tax=Thalassobacillus pellis TaxID=748008 RepID=UPI0019618BC4|nr:CPBP family intramembrane glutamic endopeptidase [Thalassobacillus pellis]MBM7552431.1 membrane protease YdiL (CAAX protease family) [Thalassobacillus pellis]